jgi:DNA-binding NarL/FixJ family response regulator
MNTPPRQVKVLLVEDHAIVRDGVRSLLEEEKRYRVMAEAGSGEQALERMKNQKFDLAVVDINMAGMNGIEFTRHAKRLQPEMKVLALTMLSEEEHIRMMIEAGANGYILKNSSRTVFSKAIETILAGDSYYSEEVTRTVMRGLEGKREKSRTPLGLLMELSDREREVLRLIVQQFTNQEIAGKLFISVRTVDAHRRNMMEKIGARNTAGLVKFALENHIG